jgi:TRAP-type C4-dicarboxylate transport system substrate-binding protein
MNIKWCRGYGSSIYPKFVMGCLLVFLCAGGAAEERIKLTIASSHSPSLPWVGTMPRLIVAEANQRLAAMDSEYRIEWREAYGGSLYKYQNTLEAVGIGLTDIGWVGTLWEGSRMPLQNVTYNTPFVADDLVELLDIMNELHDEMPILSGAWTDQNQVFLGASGVDTYHLMTNFPVNSVEDLKGRKILAPGPSATWLEGTGAVAVDGGLTTYYTQLQTGVADGVVTIITGAVPYRIHEVAPYLTLVDIGVQYNGGVAINLDTWNRLPDEVRGVIGELGREYSRAMADEVVGRYESALATLREEGAIVTEFPPKEKQKWIDGLPNIAARWADNTERRGHPGWEVLRAFMDAVRSRGTIPLRDWDKE